MKYNQINSTRIEKYPLLITVCFFLITSYVAFFHHNYWTFDQDGIYYLIEGKEILSGNGKNVGLPDAPAGGPIVYAVLNLLFDDGFALMKAISVLSGTGMVFFSYYTIKNIFNSKIALVGQLFFAFNPWGGIFSIQAANELLPIFLVSIALYYITKKELKSTDMIIIGSLLGVAFSIRLQVIIVLITIITFLVIKDQKFVRNFSYIGLTALFFFIAISPLVFYNYSTHGNIIDTDSNFYIASHSKYRTIQWVDQLYEGIGKGTAHGIFLDFDLFVKNYFYNLFYSIPNNLFYFDSSVNSSLIPIIPFASLIPILGAVLYSYRIKFNRINLIVSLGSVILTGFLILYLGDLSIHFFAILIIPVISLGILSVRNIQKNFLPLLLLPVIFAILVSIIPVRAPQHFSLLWLSVATLGAIFFVRLIPKFYFKIKHGEKKDSAKLSSPLKTIIIILILIVLSINFIYSFVTFVLKTTENSFENINEFTKLLEHERLYELESDANQIGQFLSEQPKINDSYIMGSNISDAYYANSKFIATVFTEGPPNDTIENFITKKNWKDWEIYISNIHSIPMDRQNLFHSTPDYLIVRAAEYSEMSLENQPNYLDTLMDPHNPEIPKNFEFVFQSSKGTIIYKIENSK